MSSGRLQVPRPRKCAAPAGFLCLRCKLASLGLVRPQWRGDALRKPGFPALVFDHAKDTYATARSGEMEAPLHRHARACRGHPRLSCGSSASKTWMAGTSPAMTPN